MPHGGSRTINAVDAPQPGLPDDVASGVKAATPSVQPVPHPPIAQEPQMANGFQGFSNFFDEIDDWCGTKVPRHFPPKPKAFRDLMLAAVLGGIAERVSDTRLQAQIKALAADLHGSAARGLIG